MDKVGFKSYPLPSLAANEEGFGLLPVQFTSIKRRLDKVFERKNKLKIKKKVRDN